MYIAQAPKDPRPRILAKQLHAQGEDADTIIVLFVINPVATAQAIFSEGTGGKETAFRTLGIRPYIDVRGRNTLTCAIEVPEHETDDEHG